MKRLEWDWLLITGFVVISFAVLFVVKVPKKRIVEKEKTVTLVDTIKVPMKSVWNARWFALTGDLKRGGQVGSQTLPIMIDRDWKTGKVFKHYDNYIAMVAESRIFAPSSKSYRFELGADDGARLFIDDSVVLEKDWESGGGFRKVSADVPLKAGQHTMKLEYWEKTGKARLYFRCPEELTQWKRDSLVTRDTTMMVAETTVYKVSVIKYVLKGLLGEQ